MGSYWLLIYIVFFLGLIAALVYWAIHNGRSGAVAVRAPRSSRDVVQTSVHALTVKGWTTTTCTDRSATFTRQQSPGCAIAIVLFVFGIIPGLIYWAAGKRAISVSVVATDVAGHPGQSDVQVSWSRDGGARGPSLELLSMLAPGVPLQIGPTYAPNTFADQWEEASGGALSEAQLRHMQTQYQGSAQPGLAGPGLVSPGQTTPAQAAGPSCAACGAAMQAEDRFCAICGAALTEDKGAPRSCLGCGGTLRENAQFCPLCGRQT